MKKLKHYLLLFLDLFRPAPTIYIMKQSKVRERQADGSYKTRDATPEETRRMHDSFKALRNEAKGMFAEMDKTFDEMEKAFEEKK